MRDLKCLTTKEVARLFRVGDATVKRWQTAGLLQSERTSGGHRRFRPEEVARFQREHKLGQKTCVGDESVVRALSGRQRECKSDASFDSAFFRALMNGCEEAAANVLINKYLEGKSPAEICDEIVCPAMFQIGELWAAGKVNITQEHLASRVAHNAVYKLRQSLAVSKTIDKLAICCAAAGDSHELPTHLAQINVENEGWATINYGADTPFADLSREINRHAPALVCVSMTIITDADNLACHYKLLRARIAKLNIPIAVGGRAFQNDEFRQKFPAEFYPRSFGELSEYVRAL